MFFFVFFFGDSIRMLYENTSVSFSGGNPKYYSNLSLKPGPVNERENVNLLWDGIVNK